MNPAEWRAQRDNRSLRYAGRVLDPNRSIVLRCNAEQIRRYDTQVAILTAANLFSRMSPAVALDIPSTPLAAGLPWAGRDFRDFALESMFKADPYGNFSIRSERTGDYLLQLGASGGPLVAHGTGWNCYLGPGPSPLSPDETFNPIGPALAAILSATEAFKNELRTASASVVLLNAYDWRSSAVSAERYSLPRPLELGDIWAVGTGSVGTAILYFLAMATRDFSTTLFDMDVVKIHNLDRSPIFACDHVGVSKVHATAAFLRNAGVLKVRTEPCALDESSLWKDREQGTPDLLIAAANERNVRSTIEANFPPLQIYGTTGKNWQAAMIRHRPLVDPCSVCLFPEETFVATDCATGQVNPTQKEERVDAALPFLSFAAGVMAAAEVLKAGAPTYPFNTNRVVLNTLPTIRAVSASLAKRDGCICSFRSSTVHRTMIAGSRFSRLS